MSKLSESLFRMHILFPIFDVRNLVTYLGGNILPNLLVIGCENDDFDALKIIQNLHSQPRSQMKVILQLPTRVEHEQDILNKISQIVNCEFEILYDHDSRNHEAICRDLKLFD